MVGARLRLCAALFGAMFLIHPVPAQTPPTTLHVSASDATCGGNSPCYATIQAAVNAAGPGNVVRVRPGIYPGLVRITGKQDLTVEGDPDSLPGTAVIAPADGGLASCLLGTGAVEIASSSGITLRRLAVHGYDGSGVRVRGGAQGNSDVALLGLQVTATGRVACGAGIAIEVPNAGTLIAHNLVYANVRDGIALAGGPVQLTAAPQYLWSNTVYGNGRHGVRASGFVKPYLWNNLIAGNGTQTVPVPLLPAYGVARDLTGLLVPLTGSQAVLHHNLLCGNRSGELHLAANEVPTASGNQTPTGSQGAGFAASPGCDDPALLFEEVAGEDGVFGTLDDDFFPLAASPAVEAGADPPTALALDLAILQEDFERAPVRPADGDGDGLFHYDVGALEYGVAPTIAIVAPEDQSEAGSAEIEVSGTFTGTAALTIDVNGEPATLTGSTFAASVTLVEGENTLTATATNAFGTASDSVTVTLSGLAVEIAQPLDGATVRSSEVDVSGTFAGAGPVAITVNGQPATLTGQTFTASVPLAQGANTLTATATNEFGSVSDAVAVTVPPLAVEITAPLDGSAADTPLVEVTGTFDGAEPVAITVNGQTAALTGQTFTASVPLAQGANTLTATATNDFGSVTDSVTVNVAPLSVDILAPASGSAATTSPIEVSGQFTGAGAVAVTVNGQPAVLVGSTFVASVSLAEGTNTLTAIASNAFGSVSDAVTVMLPARAVEILDPLDGSLANTPILEVSGTFAGATPISVSVNGEPATLADATFTASVPLVEGENTLTATVTNSFGSTSHAITVTVQPLSIAILGPPEGVADGSLAEVFGQFTGAAPVTITVNGEVAILERPTFSATVPLGEGENTLTATAANAFAIRSDSRTVTLPPLAIEIESPADGAVTDQESALVTGSVNDEDAAVEVNGVAAVVSGHTFSAPVPLTPFTNPVTATASRNATSDTDERTVIRASQPPPEPPPSAAAVASPPDPTVAADIASSVEFLYSGPDPIQSIPNPSVIDELRVGVVRGRVLTRSGGPMPGVTISVHGRPEFGTTHTQADGFYDLAVNGGASLALDFAMPGYIPAQRQVTVSWLDYARVDDVVLVPFSPVTTSIAAGAGAPAQVARGPVSSDASGTRQATVFFPAGTAATMQLPGGGSQSLSALTVRLTEFTVGTTGPAAMPGTLPASSGYTYAVELSADEVVSAGAKSVVFSQPVSVYVENFLDMPVGTIVPFGSYDYASASWVPETNGTVIRIDDEQGGLAVVSPASVVLSNDEKTKLAELYEPGDELWRSTTTHFTPMDKNYPRGFPANAQNPPAGGVQPHTPIKGCPTGTCGSVIENETQVLGEQIDLAEIPYALHYRSDRVSGYAAARTIRIPVTVGSPPASVQRVDVTVDVEGRRSKLSFPRTGPSYFPFTWDGLDAYGRAVNGTAKGKVRVGWVYSAVYQEPRGVGRSFAQPSETQVQITLDSGREEAIAWRTYETSFGAIDARGFAVGGWTLSPHHFYDPDARVLHRGDGQRVSALGVNQVIRHFAGVFSSANGTGIPGPATLASFGFIREIAVAADGTVYFTADNRVFKIDRAGIIRAVTAASGPTGDGGLAINTFIQLPYALAVGSDGSLYIKHGLFSDPRIRRVRPDGVITTVAGTGANCTSPNQGEGALATTVPLCRTGSRLEVGPDGSVFFASEGTRTFLRRVKPDGTLETVLGGGTGALENVSARQWGGNFQHFTLDRDGRVYFVADTRIYAIRPEDSIVKRVAGGGTPADGIGDGLPAIDASLSTVRDLAPAPDGGIYVAEVRFTPQQHGRVRLFTPGGTIRTVAGNGTDGLGGNGRVGTQAPIARELQTISTGPDGTVYIGEIQQFPSVTQIRHLSPVFPARGAGEITIAAEDGSEVYDFDASGRHLRTRHALTGADLREFQYANGRLVAIRELAPSGNAADDLVTTIERNGSGQPTAIVGPYGAHTDLTVDGNGYLSSVANALDETYTLDHSASGLLETFTPPEGGDHTFTYDALGLLIRDEDPVGGFTELARTEDSEAVEVDLGTALGRTKTARLEPSFLGPERRIFTNPAGLVSTLQQEPGRLTNASVPDGTTTQITHAPDPRLGLSVPIPESEITRTPASITRTRTYTRTATVDALGNLTQQVDTIALNGRSTVFTWTGGATRRLSTRSPLVRRLLEDFDPQGRLLRSELVGLDPVTLGYDERGRLESTSQGSGADLRATALAYHPDGNLETITDALGRQTRFEYDGAGRVTRSEAPGGRVTLFAYDGNGNLASLTPPDQPAHVFRYTLLDQEHEYEPPAVDASDPRTVFTYDLDRALTRVDRPDGEAVVLDYQPTTGRLETVTTPRGTTTQTYHPTSGNVSGLAAPGGEGLAFTYDGSLPKRTTWSGTTSGYVEHGYDSDFRIASQNVNGAFSVTFGYDNDSLLTGAGALGITRHAQTGLPTNTSLGVVATSMGYNGFGEPTSESATISGSNVYATTFTRDKLGRITEKIETIQGVTTTYGYRYDLAGRLDQVKHDGAIVRTYTYDANGNRLSDGTSSGSYDDQDRITSYGTLNYVHDAAGDLTSRTGASGTTAYAYDALGNLTQVDLPAGTTITYAIDGQNRRVAKRMNGTVVKRWLYQDQLEPVAELDGSGNVVSRFVYGTKPNVPEYMVQGSNTYRILSDHVGSVRLVVNTSTGTVAQRIDYDEFGNVTDDTNPGFQPFGFAGGLYDADTGLTRFGARDYDAQIGRWTTKDPIRFGGGLNLYGYVMADPINEIDPSGLDPVLDAVLKRFPDYVADDLRKDIDRIADSSPSDSLRFDRCGMVGRKCKAEGAEMFAEDVIDSPRTDECSVVESCCRSQTRGSNSRTLEPGSEEAIKRYYGNKNVNLDRRTGPAPPAR